MKKILCLIAGLSLLSGCDDGDMTFKSFDFSGEDAQSCNDSNIFFKINGEEALLLTLTNDALRNEETPDGEPREVTVGGSGGNTITYRDYEGAVTSGMLCTTPAPAFPGIQEEWTGDGTLLVTTQAIVVEGRTTGYNHEITIQSATFTKGDESVTINNNLFGVIRREFDFTFDFISEGEEEPEVGQCIEKDLIYTIQGKEALILDLQDGILPTEEDTVEIVLDGFSDDNRIIFEHYDIAISASRICDEIEPISPVKIAQYFAISGTIIIKTTEEGPGLSHRIYLKDVVLASGTDVLDINDIAEIDSVEQSYYFGNYTIE